MRALGWDALDIVFVMGDTYIDSPYSGVAMLGNLLVARGFRVGVIAQPAVDTAEDITRLPEPTLWWGVTAGAVDSMVANHTALSKRRHIDDFTPGGVNDRRPDRASIVYTNLIRRHFRNTVPIVLGGIEASLRRIAHYDFWSDSVRRSLLFDAKADAIIYGMAERTVLDLSAARREGRDWRQLPGLAHIAKAPVPDFIELPSFEAVSTDHHAFIAMFHTFHGNCEPPHARGLCQKHGDRWLIHNPPAAVLEQEDLDEVYAQRFEHDVHPWYKSQGRVKALDTVAFSITTHRGCYGECHFCAITMHQGRRVVSRSERAIMDEAQAYMENPRFKGVIRDVGGPTANMYGIDCRRMPKAGTCDTLSCVATAVCRALRNDHSHQIRLLRRLRRLRGVRRVFVASGIRYDMVMADHEHGDEYIREIALHHTSGQLKLAPEHVDPDVLRLMNKPGVDTLERFKQAFDRICHEEGMRQYLTYYFIVAHPGDSEQKVERMRAYAARTLRMAPEQVQVFTPLPSTWSAVMYHTGLDPFTLLPIHVEKDFMRKRRMKALMVGK